MYPSAELSDFLDVFLQSGRSPDRNGVLTGIQNNAISSSVDFAMCHMTSALILPTKQELWDYAYKMSPLARMDHQADSQAKELIGLEFGVYKGASLSYFANIDARNSWFGFDSFIGLEEDWSGTSHEKGFFSLDGVLPPVPKNATLVPGLFEDTLPDFKAQIKAKHQIAFLHLDADAYSPTFLVLESIFNHFAERALPETLELSPIKQIGNFRLKNSMPLMSITNVPGSIQSKTSEKVK
jgi:hypothetical protein